MSLTDADLTRLRHTMFKTTSAFDQQTVSIPLPPLPLGRTSVDHTELLARIAELIEDAQTALTDNQTEDVRFALEHALQLARPHA